MCVQSSRQSFAHVEIHSLYAVLYGTNKIDCGFSFFVNVAVDLQSAAIDAAISSRAVDVKGSMFVLFVVV